MGQYKVEHDTHRLSCSAEIFYLVIVAEILFVKEITDEAYKDRSFKRW